MNLLVEIVPSLISSGAVLVYMVRTNQTRIGTLERRTERMDRSLTQVVTYLKGKNGKGLD